MFHHPLHQMQRCLLIFISVTAIPQLIMDCCVVAAPATAMIVGGQFGRLPPKGGSKNTKSSVTESGEIVEDLPVTCDPIASRLQSTKSFKTKAIASTTVSLFYAKQCNFIFISMEPYDNEHFGKLISYTRDEFNVTHVYETCQTNEDESGLVKAAKVNDSVTLNLNGISPYYNDSIFEVSRYLCLQGETPVANYILIESTSYPGHYIRRYDDGVVDCEPKQETVPTNRTYFYWRPTEATNGYTQLVSLKDVALSFANGIAHMSDHPI